MDEVAFSRRVTAARVAALCLIIALSCCRLAHIHLLWADEDHSFAAALEMLHGKVLYRDIFYDKPPLTAAFYLLTGGHPGWPLRLLGVAYILLACYLAYRLARIWWGEAEAWISAFLLAFFTTFYLPSAVIAMAADALMIAPHLAAIYCARQRRPFWAGIYASLAFLVNTKGVFVLAVCAIWLWPEWPLLLAGFVLPAVAAACYLVASGAWAGYIEEVWRWGMVYAKLPLFSDPFRAGAIRTFHWLGFHIALAAGAIFAFLRISRSDRWKLGSWFLISFAGVCLGSRFSSHYYFQILPPLLIAASGGIVLALREYKRPAIALLTIMLLVPLIRFGPRYVSLTIDNLRHREPAWSDVAMDLDSQHAARKIRALAHPGDTLFVWGFRSDLYVYTGLISDSRFLDSQPLDGVPADRHLYSTATLPGFSARPNREQLTHSHPTFLVDGLSPFNPKLKPSNYPDLRSWLSHYKLVGRTRFCLIYHRID